MARDPVLALLDELNDDLRGAIAYLQDMAKTVAQFRRTYTQAAPKDAKGSGSPAGSLGLRYTGATVPEAAVTLGCSEEHIRRLLRDGTLTGVPLGGRLGWRIDRAELAEAAAAVTLQRSAREKAKEPRRRNASAAPGRSGGEGRRGAQVRRRKAPR